MNRPATAPTGTRERFVAATLILLRQGGLPAAGLADVVALARAPKGSLYHYFPQGKSQMVAEALVAYRDAVAGQLAAALGGDAQLPRRVTRLFEHVAQRMADSGFGQSCAVGAVVLDLRSGNDGLRLVCQAALAHWADTAAAHLHELPAAQRSVAGRLLVTLLEGAQLAARAAGHAGPLHEAAAAFLAYAGAVGQKSSSPSSPSPPNPQRPPKKAAAR